LRYESKSSVIFNLVAWSNSGLTSINGIRLLLQLLRKQHYQLECVLCPVFLGCHCQSVTHPAGADSSFRKRGNALYTLEPAEFCPAESTRVQQEPAEFCPAESTRVQQEPAEFCPAERARGCNKSRLSFVQLRTQRHGAEWS